MWRWKTREGLRVRGEWEDERQKKVWEYVENVKMKDKRRFKSKRRMWRIKLREGLRVRGKCEDERQDKV